VSTSKPPKQNKRVEFTTGRPIISNTELSALHATHRTFAAVRRRAIDLPHSVRIHAA
jgi:hypothetical protein